MARWGVAVTQFALSFPAGSAPVATSEDAADALTGEVLSARRMKVLRLIAASPDGLTADEVVARLGGRHNTWAPRVTELLQVGFLDRLDGKQGRDKVRRPTRDGGTGFVHRASARGLRYLEEDRHSVEHSVSSADVYGAERGEL